MQIRVLGCSGGVGAGLRTTSLLLDDDILIDAGTGVGDLSIEEMAALRHIFVSHSHLDHIAAIPLLVDTIFDHLDEPIRIHGLQETLDALRNHVFNNVIWPDFTRLPDPRHPVLRYAPMAHNRKFHDKGRTIEMVNVNHIVPGVGFIIEQQEHVFAFSGDTTTNDTFWAALNRRPRLDLLLVECAFANKDEDLARRACHYCPRTLAEDLEKLTHHPDIYISHNKPGDEDLIFAECQAAVKDRTLHRLNGGQQFTL
ncbi:MAG TPA: 3',5'-cyclic-nucleotide phosphodiesterase [Gammaproteobacteria bacterium]|nr:3',5'-cyclic-nucleotide phosphodiesterase [Gammaproteobacteria bacterium]